MRITDANQLYYGFKYTIFSTVYEYLGTDEDTDITYLLFKKINSDDVIVLPEEYQIFDIIIETFVEVTPDGQESFIVIYDTFIGTHKRQFSSKLSATNYHKALSSSMYDDVLNVEVKSIAPTILHSYTTIITEQITLT